MPDDRLSDLIVRHIGRLTTWEADHPVRMDAALVVRAGAVAWVGADRDLPAVDDESPELDAAGAAVIPGFVDAHTHAVWAGDRREELAARVAGQTYAAGGIKTTVDATRAASEEELLSSTVDRLRAMRRAGTTTVEIKSGYDLTPDGELRLLRIAGAAATVAGVAAERTFLGAHVVPAEAAASEGYVDGVIAALPAARDAGAGWCDVFCDRGAFTVEQSRRILQAAAVAGLGLRIHAEQLTRTGAAELAAELGCASADHLEQVDEEGARALATARVVAVVAPAAGLQTRQLGAGHVERLRAAGATLALATDCNPGTSWCESMPLAIQLGCWLWGLSVAEALRAATLGGAAALRRRDIGHLAPGARADFVILDTDHESDLALHLRPDLSRHVIVRGVLD
jgi:imidazolonepropionase